jgi:ATP-dependent DNA helicase PIF1
MITHNIDIPNQIVNGTRAIIVSINQSNILIKTVNNMLYNISYVKYTNELDNDIEYNYIPIKLAYSITIHKSQGQTLDYLEIDLGNSIFGNGMGYVALSRAKTLNSIYLSDLSRSSFRVSDKVIEFYKNINN